jgi:hypothetical protein
MFKVVSCFFSYRKVHIALRSTDTLGHGGHKKSQVPDLWLESDYLFPTNFCSICGCHSHKRSSCEQKDDAVFCGRTDHVGFNCPRKASARSVFAFLALKHIIASGYWESTEFTPVLNAVISRDEHVPLTWPIPVGSLPTATGPDPELSQDSDVRPSDAIGC